MTDPAATAQAALDAKTKPRGSLGRLEELACRIAAIRGTAEPGRLRAAIVVAAADHGVADEGVSAYPQEVTRQMLANFAGGGAAVSVLARAAGAAVHVVDAGVGRPSGNIAVGPAMTRADAEAALAAGRGLATGLEAEIVGLGEMGIANSTVAAALAAALLTARPEDVCGRGTGLDDVGVANKVEVVRRALAANAVDADDPVGVLAALGGAEIATLAGVALGAAATRRVVLLDGFISSTAALVAARIEPASRDAMIAAHRSPEPGHALVLDALGLEPLLDLGLRLGEGSGAALALPIIDASLAILADMATFDAAGVTDAGR
ncbi:MAG TPA: nicotinate-nucleotide--dimethylbenzimidazole phosphoribosyltransferase [Planctomycetota bacterium]|nr:nicotinate-nucleotide--dimethylbenzimidazole phosphoribosyltransferase [Planctomycetota bacterium]